ncbi:single-stranded-DNA-specific exonuclease RecJ [Finegoldia magna]|uniref:single-stranded-DNA-specific exonuclease RecJ n=1 Tax=Finegoldia magna TaxID=1260 RepID=UPI000B91A0A2|nr:single-stranded-DNA-specific exonuclease RecJ [Finegoldia magna]MDU2132319.1 single-stranded-DNA-specific exonuclease RecJ [Finegoldia magna]MDU2219810.1 single-stranded-DNA-specific exonuclease RecJ [Finegoldia magna]MDU4277170.1 single-stranded-DNA-specific exonuclease RecJ [Finegoldia magna]MDU5069650.1 single-stranded-DNA-specific exonuclease RecJ [Finegoldia magna]MDU6552858.1 single-stranded-DNA-specific exonuclease RecJ [Finegoldia magna]
MNKWLINNRGNNFSEVSQRYNIHPLIAKILLNRNITDFQIFLNPNAENSYHDPFLMKDMDRAVDIIINAIENDQNIRIVGDYDQDGNSSTMTLLDGLGYFTDKLSYDIPNRMTDGYGISFNIIDKCIEDNIDLIITCDNGISAIEQCEYAKQNGLKIIVTDHHQTIKHDGKEIIPNADAVINPQQQSCKYPFKSLCGAGVCYKLIQAINVKKGYGMLECENLLQYVAMGTVCDIVDLKDENRYFVTKGLQEINNTDNYGLKCLIEMTGIRNGVNVYSLGFIIGPCINAAGRLDTAKLGVELFRDENMDNVEAYAKILVDLNEKRKKLTEEGFNKAVEIIENTGLINDDILICNVEGIHESVCGIIAGRIKEKYNKPTLILTKSENENVLKGSGRSISEYDIFKEFDEFREMFVSFGGHPMACGLSIEEDKLDEFRTKVNQNSRLTEEDLVKKILIDSSFFANKIDFDLIEEIDRLRPFGKANPRPILGDRDLEIIFAKIIGKNKNVLKLKLLKNNKTIDAILFSEAIDKYNYLLEKFGENVMSQLENSIACNAKIDIIYYPEINDFNNVKNIQLNLIDLR